MKPETLLTPSKIAAFLDCAHYLTLRDQVDAGELELSGGLGSFADLLMEKGLRHEEDCLAHYRAEGKTVFDVPARRERESFAQWVDRVGNPMADGHDVIYQMPFVHDGMRGVADFLIKVPGADGTTHYEPLDAKLARSTAKPAHVLQLCFYAEAMEALTGHAPGNLHIWLGSGDTETVAFTNVAAYWNRLRQQLRVVLATSDDPEAPVANTEPDPCSHCQFCEFSVVCEDQWRDEDSLVFVANLVKRDRVTLKTGGVATMEALAVNEAEVPPIPPERLDRVVKQAFLQVQARHAPDALPPLERLPVDPLDIAGFNAMPAPDDGDVFLDYEGHPFWRADAGLFFLVGLILKNGDGEWTYEARWAHDRTEEAQIFADLIEWLDDRRRRYPAMHVYHYNHTERSSLERMVIDHDLDDATVVDMIDSGLFVDLYAVIGRALLIGTESYGLKSVERLAGFERVHDVQSGAGAVVEYDRYCHAPDPLVLERIALYNEEDVRATLAVRDWLTELRPADLPWREAVVVTEIPEQPELDEQVKALKAFDDGTPQHLLGDLLEYWRRESRFHFGQMRVKAMYDRNTQIASPDIVTGLVFDEWVDQVDSRGKPKKHRRARFTFPPQTLDPNLAKESSFIYLCGTEKTSFATVEDLDIEAGSLHVVWDDSCKTEEVLPEALVNNSWVRPRPKDESLAHVADRALEGDTTSPLVRLAFAVLQNEKPRFDSTYVLDAFEGDLEHMKEWVLHMDASCVAVQGPPGSGKTYNGARLIKHLIDNGRRVGVTSNSHAAVTNLMNAVAAAFEEEGRLGDLNAIQKIDGKATGPIERTKSQDKLNDRKYALVGGTAWHFGNSATREGFDVLVVDEAGQLSLADMIACTPATKNIVLLGDPQQLANVSQAQHPNRSGVSVLQHVLGDHETIEPDRGVFLSVTRRMHPDVCDFISEQFYEGRLTSHDDCAVQRTGVGTGLRWLPVEHTGCSTHSEVEAEAVHRTVLSLLGQSWTDKHGATSVLTAHDILVVAPYNAQVDLVRNVLGADEETEAVRVGTVDKLQGQEAAVVVFTMTASTGDDIPRGIDFLFSRNRLNVAISRAKALAVLVCTEQLLNTRARDVPDMELISALCAFVEKSDVLALPSVDVG